MPDTSQMTLPGYDQWTKDYTAAVGDQKPIHNRSGIEVKPLYTADDWNGANYSQKLGFPGAAPYTRGIYPSMHRGKTWSQRQLIGLGLPADYNKRQKRLVDAGASALSMIPCNSIYRGIDADQVEPVLLGTCGAVINTVDDMQTCLDGIAMDSLSTALNDPLPFTMLAQLLIVAERRGVAWNKITGTSNQSDYISHFVANHMFFRIALPGSRRVLLDHIAYTHENVPGWNPLSVVGQHTQQGGATPAQAMAYTLSSAIQYAEDCRGRGMDLQEFLPRFTFFFDISISFFEEIAKFRAGRRIWARIVKERFGIDNPRAQRFKFHAQTSGVDLTRQQPLNNIARVSTQAIAGIFGGLQSLHTDSYDEVLSVPTEEAARIAVATQNILREEAHLTDVIDPLGGSYYVESLTDQMEEEILSVMQAVEERGGMYRAVETGWVQGQLGKSAMDYQRRIDSGQQTVVGVNAYQIEQEAEIPTKSLPRPREKDIEGYLESLADFKKHRDNDHVDKALDALAQAANTDGVNLFGQIIEATRADATQGEIIAVMRKELGFGDPLIIA
ncbi:MAG: acyl-CoA mutase large subunit family protein [Rhodospirillales bacterium]|nr:acyl-CoA mutase large subunit family protein [Rhodospirillales bacterium]